MATNKDKDDTLLELLLAVRLIGTELHTLNQLLATHFGHEVLITDDDDPMEVDAPSAGG